MLSCFCLPQLPFGIKKMDHPKVSIDLTGQQDGFVCSYSTWDRIEGTAIVEVDHDTWFDDIEIVFEGTH